MARLLHFRRTLLPLSSPFRPRPQPSAFSLSSPRAPARTYISEMRKSAFEGNLLRLIRNEVDYELELRPPSQPVNRFGFFAVNDRSGEQWISLKSKYGDDEDITIEATMFDGTVPLSKSAVIDGEDAVQLHITIFVTVSKADSGNMLEFVCSALPNALDIRRLYARSSKKMVPQAYLGPEFKELDDELQESLYEYLDARGVNDALAGFLHEYMRNKDKTELIRWMGTLKSFIEKKSV